MRHYDVYLWIEDESLGVPVMHSWMSYIQSAFGSIDFDCWIFEGSGLLGRVLSEILDSGEARIS